MKQMDVDFVFTHQPELLFNIMTGLMDERYGEIVNRFLFFHWVDCPQSRGSSAIPHSYMRQLEAINQCNKVFFHTDIASEYFEKNWNKDWSTSLNLDYVKSKSISITKLLLYHKVFEKKSDKCKSNSRSLFEILFFR